MDLPEIIGMIIAIPVFIFIVIRLVLLSWVEGIISDILLQIAGVPPILIAVISIVGGICLVGTIILLALSKFG